jgi:hypothetical protein
MIQYDLDKAIETTCDNLSSPIKRVINEDDIYDILEAKEEHGYNISAILESCESSGNESLSKHIIELVLDAEEVHLKKIGSV